MHPCIDVHEVLYFETMNNLRYELLKELRVGTAKTERYSYEINDLHIGWSWKVIFHFQSWDKPLISNQKIYGGCWPELVRLQNQG